MTRMLCLFVLSTSFCLMTRASAQEPVSAAGHHQSIEIATPATVKVCATECQPTKKTVYSSVEKQYCLAERGLLDWLHGCLFGSDDGCNHCGQVRTKTVLVKKIVPGKPVERCVLKEIIVNK